MSEPLILFGGSFDPVHRGHIEAALEVSTALDGANVAFLPNARSPLKQQTVASNSQRLAMLKLALARWPQLSINHYEISRPGPSFTYNTLSQLRYQSPSAPLILAIGADNFAQLDRWYGWQQLPQLCHLVVLPRPKTNSASATITDTFPEASASQLLSQPCGYRLMLNRPLVDLSSTQIREQIANNQPADLSTEVMGYIQDQQLYHSAL